MTIEAYQRAQQIHEEIYFLKRLLDRNEEFPFSIVSNSDISLSKEIIEKRNCFLPTDNIGLNNVFINNVNEKIKLLKEEFKNL